MSDIDPVQFGRLLESVEQLTEKLDQTSEHLDKVNQRLDELENRWTMGKSGIAGIALGLGFAIWGVKDTLTKIAEWFTP